MQGRGRWRLSCPGCSAARCSPGPRYQLSLRSQVSGRVQVQSSSAAGVSAPEPPHLSTACPQTSLQNANLPPDQTPTDASQTTATSLKTDARPRAQRPHPAGATSPFLWRQPLHPPGSARLQSAPHLAGRTCAGTRWRDTHIGQTRTSTHKRAHTETHKYRHLRIHMRTHLS